MNENSRLKTIPATEENLILDDDIHPFDNNPPEKLSQRHPVIVDGILGEACVGCLGGYSTRINIALQEKHPELGNEFQTKYFMFTKPGFVQWGHQGKSFKIEKIVSN